MSEGEGQVEFVLDDAPTKVESKKDEPIIEIVDQAVSADDGQDKPHNVEKALKKLTKKLEKEKFNENEKKLKGTVNVIIN